MACLIFANLTVRTRMRTYPCFSQHAVYVDCVRPTLAGSRPTPRSCRFFKIGENRACITYKLTTLKPHDLHRHAGNRSTCSALLSAALPSPASWYQVWELILADYYTRVYMYVGRMTWQNEK